MAKASLVKLVVIGLRWYKVNNGSGNGLVASGNKPLPDPMLIQIFAHWQVWHKLVAWCPRVRRLHLLVSNPGSKVQEANMGPTWVLSVPDGPHAGPMNLAIMVCTVRLNRRRCMSSKRVTSCLTWSDTEKEPFVAGCQVSDWEVNWWLIAIACHGRCSV